MRSEYKQSVFREISKGNSYKLEASFLGLPLSSSLLFFMLAATRHPATSPSLLACRLQVRVRLVVLQSLRGLG